MKKFLTLTIIFLSTIIFAQTQTAEQRVFELPIVKMRKNVNIHFISPEPIQFMDLSSSKFAGDLPSTNIARVKILDKPIADSINASTQPYRYYVGENVGVITIVGQSFMAQYKAIYADTDDDYTLTNIAIQPEQMQPLEAPKNEYSQGELYMFSKTLLKRRVDNPLKKEKALGLEMFLNNIYVMDDYIFLDLTFNNNTNLSYNIDAINFSIEDKKIYKATNNQSIPMTPIYIFTPAKQFKKEFRNIYVFKKFTFPNSKILNIRMVEEQVSGRTIEMKVNYSDVLNADSF